MAKRIVRASVLLLAASLSALAGGLNGAWKAEVPGPSGNGHVPVTLNFQVDGDKLTGDLEAVGQHFPITQGKVKGNEIFFATEGSTGLYTGKLEGDVIKMAVTFKAGSGGKGGARTFPFLAKRAQ